MQQKSRLEMTVQWSAQKLGRLLHTYLHPTLGADEGSGSLGSLLLFIIKVVG